MSPVPRPDLNGILITNSNGKEPWYLVDEGLRRAFSSGTLLNKIIRSTFQVIKDPNVDQIAPGPAWPDDVQIVGPDNSTLTCLYDGNAVRLIPNGLVFEQYQFDWSKRRAIPAAQWPRISGPHDVIGKPIDTRAAAKLIGGAFRQTVSYTETGTDFGQGFNTAVANATPNGTNTMFANMMNGVNLYTNPAFAFSYHDNSGPSFSGIEPDTDRGRNAGSGPVVESTGGIAVDVNLMPWSDFDISAMPSEPYILEIECLYNVYGDLPANGLLPGRPPGAGSDFDIDPTTGIVAEPNFTLDAVTRDWAGSIGNQWSSRNYSRVFQFSPPANPQALDLSWRFFSGRFVQFLSCTCTIRQV